MTLVAGIIALLHFNAAAQDRQKKSFPISKLFNFLRAHMDDLQFQMLECKDPLMEARTFAVQPLIGSCKSQIHLSTDCKLPETSGIPLAFQASVWLARTKLKHKLEGEMLNRKRLPLI
jgi:hypothetical protein